ncbi:WD repeat-containing protein 26 homolog isoform X2 [Andrographis paniculata]|nr:WD repeat-containing protein 26 homolog isoform X2 [Andrographis paniculata]
MARLLASEEEEVVGSKGVIKKVELVRIIADALQSLGYSDTGACLTEESGISLHTPVVELFVNQILEGRWDESVRLLAEIGRIDESVIELASFVILEQKFMELLDENKTMDALKTLRAEMAPLGVKHERMQELSLLVVFPSSNSNGETSGPERRINSRKKLLENLHKLLPPSVMVPEKRLVHLVEQALSLQKDACRFHNSSVGEMSLLADHQCGKEHMPSQTLQILQEHDDEVWFLQFSRDGKYLASSSGDCVVIIWEVAADGQISLKHRLSGHQKPVAYLSWRHCNDQLLTCGLQESVRRWDVASGECLHTYEKGSLGLVSCAWSLDGMRIFTGINDKSVSMWDLNGTELECWNGPNTARIADMGITMDGKELITICRENTIQFFGLETKSERFIEEDQWITSFVLSEDRKYLLVSLADQELHLWNIDGYPRMVTKYKGHKRARFVVRSCFGGSNQAFVASGSEDSQVYIWHRISGDLILTLSGHTGAVNCVAWNPANPYMLASASDDRTIRIWGLTPVLSNSNSNSNSNGAHSNGLHYYCNGGTS